MCPIGGLARVAAVAGPTHVRAIEYRILNRQEFVAAGLATRRSGRQLASLPEIAVMKCVDQAGQKKTVLGDATHLRHLLETGVASDPEGMDLSQPKFPVVLDGWQAAS